MNWKVKQKPAYIDVDGNRINTGYTINYKDSDNTILGVVGKNYKVVQNEDAFAFTDELAGSITDTGSLRDYDLLIYSAKPGSDWHCDHPP